MGSSLPTFERQAHHESSPESYAAASHGADREPPSRWNLHLSLSQVIVMWSVLCGTLVMAFLFGMYAGREQGLSSALEEYSAQAVRIPVAQPLAAREDSHQVLAALGEMGAQSRNSAEVSATGKPTDPETTTAEAEFDFSPESKLSLAPVDNDIAAKKSASKGATSATVGQTVPPIAPIVAKASTTETPTTSDTSMAKSKKEPIEKPKKKVEQPQAEAKKPIKTEASPEKTSLAPLSRPKIGWYVQVAAARSHAQASQVYFRADKAGLAATLEQAEVRGQNYFRVIIGPYQSRQQALDAIPSVKKKRISRAQPFLKRVR